MEERLSWIDAHIAPGVCSRCVCVHCCVCTLDGLNAEHNSEYGSPYWRMSLHFTSLHIDTRPSKDCIRLCKGTRGSLTSIKTAKSVWKACVYDTVLHGKLAPLCRPPALHRQSFFSSSNHFSLTHRHSERHKDPELPSCSCLPAQKSLTVCNTEVLRRSH